MHRNSPSPSDETVWEGNAGSLPSWTSLDSCGDAAPLSSWTALADLDVAEAASPRHELQPEARERLAGDGFGPVGNRVTPHRLGSTPADEAPASDADHGLSDEGQLLSSGDGVASKRSGPPPNGERWSGANLHQPGRSQASHTRVVYPRPDIRTEGVAAPEHRQNSGGAHSPSDDHADWERSSKAIEQSSGAAAAAEAQGESDKAAPSITAGGSAAGMLPIAPAVRTPHSDDAAADEATVTAPARPSEPEHAAGPEAKPGATATALKTNDAAANEAPPAPASRSDDSAAAEAADATALEPPENTTGHFERTPDVSAAVDEADSVWLPDSAVMAHFDAMADAEGSADAAEFNPENEAWQDFSHFMQGDGAHAVSEAGHALGGASEGFSALDLRDRVVIMLLFKQVVRIDEVRKVYLRWRKQGGGKSRDPLWRVLAEDPVFDREKIFAEAAQVYAFEKARFKRTDATAFIRRHSETFTEEGWDQMRKLRVLPIRQEVHATKKERRTIFISHDPARPEVNRLMREFRLDSFELQYAPEGEIDALIQEAFPKRNEYLDRVSINEFAYDLGTSYDASVSLIDEDALEAEISRSSLINLFEASLIEAVRQGASDIHFVPNAKKHIEIYFRVNGELECWHREERVHPEALLAVVKDNTLNVDRFERDSAQDGFIQRKVDDTIIRYRVSVLPVANANQEIRSESIAIRVLDDRKVVTDMRRLGLLAQARAKFEWAIRQPHGMVILTGPTGSGKTTTLFAALHQVVTPKVNVITVEDPVEYVIPGVRQIKLSHKLSVEQALRSILRHDPDIVMVGEMRDRETADLAIKLANTGHLTFSTLHTNDAPSAISRLYKMGVEPFLIAYAINLIVAQRLIRTLCPQCKRAATSVDHEMLRRLGFTAQEVAEVRLFDEGRAPDCRSCGGTGYNGRRAITETMAFTDEIRRAIFLAKDMIDEDTLRQMAISDGMLTLRGSAREVVKQGETSIAELIRVTAGEH